MNWDILTQTYCVDCRVRKATHTRPLGMVDATPVVEWVCGTCYEDPAGGDR